MFDQLTDGVLLKNLFSSDSGLHLCKDRGRKKSLLPHHTQLCFLIGSVNPRVGYRKYSFSGPGAYYFKRPRTPATIGGPALIRGPALNISLKFSTPLFEENCLRGFKIVK